jgi:hypothetical protein
VHSDASDIISGELNLPGVQKTTHLKPKRPQSLNEGDSTSHGPGGTIESREEPVAEVFHSTSAKAFDLLPHNIVVAIE